MVTTPFSGTRCEPHSEQNFEVDRRYCAPHSSQNRGTDPTFEDSLALASFGRTLESRDKEEAASVLAELPSCRGLVSLATVAFAPVVEYLRGVTNETL